ncbi:MAG: hypothetical protein DRG78_22495 [Epsilonproteobacteria bacterium]|nr:MAG: hypothetical protein DRG78_22495 [Campylobacterota bacterium]
MVKSAFTLIELIFAIVVIGISVVSLPMMNQVTTKSIEGNLVQEAIFIASAELNQAVTAYWDGNSLENNNSLARVIDDGTCSLSTAINPRQKLGHINQPYHRRCLDSTAFTLGTVAGIQSLDDMVQGVENLNDEDKASSGYKSTYTTQVEVTRPANFNGSNINIKEIKVTIRDKTSGDTLTVLKTYSANIGEIDYYKREY